jgi:signal transduction histidine kinase
VDAVQTFRAGAPTSGAPQSSLELRYGLVLLAVALTLVLRLLLQPVLGESAPLLIFILPVLVSAWYGGRGPGLAATVVSGLAGWPQALLEDYGERLDGTGHDYARRIGAAAGRMKQLIQDILAYSRLSRADLELVPVSFDSAVREAQAEVDLPLRQRGGEIAAEGPFPRVRAHRPTLVQVLTNLLSNAVVYVAPGAAPRIRVRAEDLGGRTRIWVEDEGIGIAPEHQERIFDVFERLHGSESYPGMESQPGAGSRFWIELQRAEESDG